MYVTFRFRKEWVYAQFQSDPHITAYYMPSTVFDRTNAQAPINYPDGSRAYNLG